MSVQGLCLLVLLFLTCGLAAEEHAGSPAWTAPAARQLFTLLNAERTREGLPALSWDERLASAAQAHAQRMADRGQLTHTLPGESPLRERLVPVPLDRSGENIAEGDSIPAEHQGLMRSPPHRANILNPGFDVVGIGVARKGNTLWIAQDFAHRMPELSDRQAEEEVVRAFVTAHAGRPLRRVENARVREVARHMAQADKLDSSQALSIPGAHHVAVYTSVDPGVLPDDARSLARLPDGSHYAAGACFAHTRQYPSGIYWIVLVLYD